MTKKFVVRFKNNRPVKPAQLKAVLRPEVLAGGLHLRTDDNGWQIPSNSKKKKKGDPASRRSGRTAK